jgi:parallel beta-helix repeat protein
LGVSNQVNVTTDDKDVFDEQSFLYTTDWSITPADSIQSLSSSQSTTIYVDDDNILGPWDGTPEHPYLTINDGIDHANENDTIFIFIGYYHETAIATKTLSFVGEDNQLTIVTDLILNAPRIDVSNLVFSSLTVLSDHAVIHRNRFIISDSGLLLGPNSTHALVELNLFQNTNKGINLQGMFQTIQYNYFINSPVSGILDSSSETTIQYNIFKNNTVGIQQKNADSNIIRNNRFILNNKAIEILDALYTNITGNTFELNTAGVATTGGLKYSLIKDNNFIGNKRSLFFVISSFNFLDLYTTYLQMGNSVNRNFPRPFFITLDLKSYRWDYQILHHYIPKIVNIVSRFIPYHGFDMAIFREKWQNNTTSPSPVYLEHTDAPRPLTTPVILSVGGDGPGNYTKIQDAINDTHVGDTVFVYDNLSPYFENLVINKSIILVAENQNTIIDGGTNLTHIIKVIADNVTIRNFTLQHYRKIPGSAGIKLLGNYTNILDNIFTECPVDAVLTYESSHFNTFTDNRITNCEDGFRFQLSNNNTITNNTFINCTIYTLWLGGDNTLLTNNTFFHCGEIVINPGLITIIHNNTFTQTIISISGQSKYTYVCHNTFTNCSYGVQIYTFCRFNFINDNYFTNCNYGVYLFHARDNYITNNTIDNTATGIKFDESYMNTISNNHITKCTNGIYFETGSNNLITTNLISGTNTGTGTGVSLLFSSYQNIFLNNTFQHFRTNAMFSISYEPTWPPYYTNTPNVFDGNYWNRPRHLPKLIIGFITFSIPHTNHHIVSPWIYIDRHPAQTSTINL